MALGQLQQIGNLFSVSTSILVAGPLCLRANRTSPVVTTGNTAYIAFFGVFAKIVGRIVLRYICVILSEYIVNECV